VVPTVITDIVPDAGDAVCMDDVEHTATQTLAFIADRNLT
jgi:hypothetical protein